MDEDTRKVFSYIPMVLRHLRSLTTTTMQYIIDNQKRIPILQRKCEAQLKENGGGGIQ